MSATVEKLTSLLRITDDQVRKEAVLAWWGTLSADERAEVSDYIQALVSQMAGVFQLFFAAIGDAGEQISRSLQKWLETPEIKAYLETLEEERDDEPYWPIEWEESNDE